MKIMRISHLNRHNDEFIRTKLKLSNTLREMKIINELTFTKILVMLLKNLNNQSIWKS